MYLLFPNDPRFVNISEKRNCNNEQNHHENRRELHPGTGLDTWQEKGLQAEFDKVLSCDMHMAVASVNIKPPKADTPPDNAVVSFRSCTIAEDGEIYGQQGVNRWRLDVLPHPGCGQGGVRLLLGTELQELQGSGSRPGSIRQRWWLAEAPGIDGRQSQLRCAPCIQCGAGA